MKAQLMLTCLCDAFFGEVGIATVKVLEHCGVEVVFPDGQTCCGQPAFNSGDWVTAREVSDRVWSVFDPEIPVVVPSASCAAMLRHGASLLLGEKGLGMRGAELLTTPKHGSYPSPPSSLRSQAPSPAGRGGQFAESPNSRRIFELSEYLLDHLEITQWPLNRGGAFRKRKVVFHQSCHGRMINLGDRQRRLLSMVPGIELIQPDQPEQCCGFGGAFAATHGGLSEGIGLEKLKHLQASGAELVVSGDMGCLMHLKTLAQKHEIEFKAMHYVQLLAEAIP